MGVAHKIAVAIQKGGVEIKHIEHGIDDYVYAVSGAWCGKPSYHKAKVYYDADAPYFRINGNKIGLDECIRM